jgi:hypothetical protein
MRCISNSLPPFAGLLAVLFFLLASADADASTILSDSPPSEGQFGGSVVTNLSPGTGNGSLSCGASVTAPIDEVLTQWSIPLIGDPACSQSIGSKIKIIVSLDSTEAIDSYLDAMLEKNGAAFLAQSYRMPCGVSTLKMFTTLNGTSWIFACNPSDFQQVQSDYGPLLNIIEMPFLCCSPPSPPSLSSPLPSPQLAPPDHATVKSVQPINMLPTADATAADATAGSKTASQSSNKSVSATFIIVGVVVAAAVAAAIAAVVLYKRRNGPEATTDIVRDRELSSSSLSSAVQTYPNTAPSESSDRSLTWIDPWATKSHEVENLRGDSILETSNGGAEASKEELRVPQ